jgi:dTDP-4-amino-4,6-dideoxygalactose transaminase
MDALLSFAASHDLKLVEDAAQAVGAEHRGRRAGSMGDAAAFSFYPTKNLGALGDGGAVVTRDAQVAEQARLLRNYGERSKYDSVRRGWNSRLDTMQAAILSAKLDRLEAWTERRRELAARYTEGLASTSLATPVEADGRRHVYHLYVIRSADRDLLQEQLAGDGIGTLVHYPRPVHLQPAYAGLARGDGALAVSERLAGEILSLPLYPELRDDEVDAVIASLQRLAPS